jgi:hypothetical protein
MRLICLAKRLPASVSALLMVLTFGAGTVLGATTLTLDPDTATPGTKVTIRNACLGVTATPPAALRAAFVSSSTPGLDPAGGSVAKAVAKAVADHYVVVVPDLSPGTYDVHLECLPGDWRTNTAEGGAQPLTVLAGAPATSTEQVDGRSSGEGSSVPLLLLGLGIIAAAAMDRLLAHRRSATR